jgi:hypothetical protein
MRHPSHGDRPGLAKIRTVPLLRRRNVTLVLADAGPMRDIVEGADVVSEGEVRIEAGAPWYYGSTSVLLLRTSAGGALPDAEIEALAAVLRSDPHARLRVLRIAHREATARSGGTLDTLRAEIDVSASARGVALLVEVVARVARGDLRSTRAPAEDGAQGGGAPIAARAHADR